MVAAALHRFKDCQLEPAPPTLPLPGASPPLSEWRVALPAKTQQGEDRKEHHSSARPLQWFTSLVSVYSLTPTSKR